MIDNEKIVKEAMSFQKHVEEKESRARSDMKSDLDAYYDDIWEAVAPGWRAMFKQYGRPVLEMGRMNPIVRRVINDIVNMEPEIKNIGRNLEDKEKAEKRQGLIRHIMYNSDAQDAIGLAALHASIMGRGHFRILTDYENDFSRDQEIKFTKIENPLNVYMDTENRYMGCQKGLLIDRMSKDDFKETYPEADPINWEGSLDSWTDTDTIAVAEFYKFKTKKRKLIVFEDGSKIYEDELDKDFKDDAKLLKVDEREVNTKVLCWYKLTSKQVLDWQELPGKLIPIATVISDEGKTSTGEIIISGVVRKSKSASWMYDLTCSLEAENMLQNSITPWTGDPRQFEGFENLYAEANSVPRAYLPHNTVVDEVTGQMLPRPDRVAPIPVSPVLYQAKATYRDDMLASSGMNEAGMGQISNEKSGRAIIARSQESKVTNSHITRSIGSALTYAGRIINQWLPIYYDTKRIISILDIEMKPGNLEINNGQIDLGDPWDDIIVTMGPGYLSGRMESMESMMQFIQAVPGLAPVISDLIAENSDWPGSQKIAERIRTTMSPDVLAAGGGADQLATKLQMAMMQLKQSGVVIEQLQMAMEQMKQSAGDNAVKLQLEEIKGQQALMLQQMKNQNAIETEMIRGDVAIQKQQLANQVQMPSVGEEIEGYIYKGGDPADQFNWEPVNG